ncbi:sodium:proton antiporter [Berryella wangjianweii]|uniref:Sodium:proton antiporter n=1 Tax=Berryella wangjianweii TaxID=2734634 RepID=A0A6M8IW17_9ACTN|nr:sodium:proton antiporter [Berryella wangjianweii]NPD32411.1 sodium:proton antiporter [Eggerthellaceae bacterium zg-997]QKF06825.1 sodium:proton antiporter [Berryella wangjianweii]
METLTLGLVILAVILVSAVVDRFIPKVSLPLIQIAMGSIVTIAVQSRIPIGLEPNIFLVLFIAPLIFHEAREIDKTMLWRNHRPALAYAIGLVLVSMVTIGLSVHALIPAIGLATAFALGAALGPTDAIAVSALGHDANIPPRQQSILMGESLLNDASGVVAFQFALAVAVGGAFVPSDAVLGFVLDFVGGVAVGVLVGLIANLVITKVRDLGLENTTFHVLFEIFIPFIAYIVGDTVGISAIICLVACGITMSYTPRSLGPSIARMNIVSSSVWKALSFTLNGAVFVLLGTQLPNFLFKGFTEQLPITNTELILYILLVSLVMYGTRFIWAMVAEQLDDRKREEAWGWPKKLRSAAITTFSGAKGAITLAVMLTIPAWLSEGGGMVRFPNRDLLIFIAAGVILISIVLATFVAPLLAPKPRSEHADQDAREEAEHPIQIMREVIQELTARQTAANQQAVAEVIRRYNNRIARTQSAGDVKGESDTELRTKALQWEQDYVWSLIDKGEVPLIEGYQFINRSAKIANSTKRFSDRMTSKLTFLRRMVLAARTSYLRARTHLPGPHVHDSADISREIQVKALRYAVERIQEEMSRADHDDTYNAETYGGLLVEYQTALRSLTTPATTITAFVNRENSVEEVLRLGLAIEMEKIQTAYEEKRIKLAEARRMRQNVMLMQLDLENQL